MLLEYSGVLLLIFITAAERTFCCKFVCQDLLVNHWCLQLMSLIHDDKNAH